MGKLDILDLRIAAKKPEGLSILEEARTNLASVTTVDDVRAIYNGTRARIIALYSDGGLNSVHDRDVLDGAVLKILNSKKEKIERKKGSRKVSRK